MLFIKKLNKKSCRKKLSRVVIYNSIMKVENMSKEEAILNETSQEKTNVKNPCEGDKCSSEQEKQLSALDAQCKDLQDKYLRAKADLDNARKRFVKDKEDIRFQTMQFVCIPFIALFDSFKMGLNSAKEHKIHDDVLKGFEMIFQQFQAQLKLLGIEEINPQNEAFNPHLHEAVSSCFHEEIPEEHIIQVVRTGYKLGDKLLRAASVVVSKGKEAK